MATARKSTKPAKKDGPKVERVLLAARTLVTIPADHPVWKLDVGERLAQALPRVTNGWEGAIVRVQPPATATDEMIASLKGWLRQVGVAAVRVDARVRGATAPKLDAPKKAHASLREAVMRHADASERRDEVKTLLDLELAKQGL